MVTLYREVKASERLPEECTEVFVLTGCGIMETGFYQDGQWYIGPNEKAVIVGPEFWLEPIEITEIEKVISEVEDMRPYKEAGNRDSYSEYNEGWSDACDVLGQAILSKLKGE